MSILIKGMEMPISCGSCMFSRRSIHSIDWCVLSEKDLPCDCPLVPVPDHGRLIDADNLRCLYDPHDYGLDGEQADEYDRYHVSLPVIRQNIDEMPTIIEAEEGE